MDPTRNMFAFVKCICNQGSTTVTSTQWHWLTVILVSEVLSVDLHLLQSSLAYAPLGSELQLALGEVIRICNQGSTGTTVTSTQWHRLTVILVIVNGTIRGLPVFTSLRFTGFRVGTWRSDSARLRLYDFRVNHSVSTLRLLHEGKCSVEVTASRLITASSRNTSSSDRFHFQMYLTASLLSQYNCC